MSFMASQNSSASKNKIPLQISGSLCLVYRTMPSGELKHLRPNLTKILGANFLAANLFGKRRCERLCQATKKKHAQIKFCSSTIELTWSEGPVAGPSLFLLNPSFGMCAG